MIERLGDFLIRRQLGEGGMGAVYLAHQESLARDVALKVLNESLCKDETFIARFRREARSAASIIHPNVIQIYSIGEENGMHFFAMEYVPGRDLRDLLAERSPLPLEEAFDIVAQVAEACACAAEVGIVHRDIKPGNIMLTERGLVKVTDFGLAKPVSSEIDVTEAGKIVGTANYMAPEQIQGQPVDVRCDMYALGVVLYELLTGQAPFVADNPSAVLYMHVYEPPPRPSARNAGVAASVDAFVARLMAKDPADRFPDFGAVLNELRALREEGGPGGEVRNLVEPGGGAESAPAPRRGEVSDIVDPLEGMPAGSLRALVADAVEEERHALSGVLAKLGFGVSTVLDASELLPRWTEEKPALALIDADMEGVDTGEILGMCVAGELAGEVILASARKDEAALAQAAADGASACLTRPVNVTEFSECVRRVMRLPSGREALSRVMDGPGAESVLARQVLVYEPGGYARRMFRSLLESLGHQPACVGDSAEAQAVLDEDAPDLAVIVAGAEDAGALEVLTVARSRATPVPTLLVVPEGEGAQARRLEEMDVGPVLRKPLRVEDLREAVAAALAGRRPLSVSRTAASSAFSRIVQKQLLQDHAYTLFDFARQLGGALPGTLRKDYLARLREGSRREVQAAIANILRRMKADGKGDLAMRYLRHAYARGDVNVRRYCLALLPEILNRAGEVDILQKVIADQDYRIRCQVIARLADLEATETIPLVVRFLNDEIWRVRKAAATALERFELASVLEPLLVFYARSGEELPDRLRKLLMKAGHREIGLLDRIARKSGSGVRAYVARFLGELRSKLAVPTLLTLITDSSPIVRAAAARAAGSLVNDRMETALFEALKDANSAVQAAAVEGLQAYRLTPAARVFLGILGDRKRRISPETLRFLIGLNASPNALERMLSKLSSQGENNRKHLSLLLSGLYPDPSDLQTRVRALAASTQGERREAVQAVVRDVKDGANRMLRQSRSPSAVPA